MLVSAQQCSTDAYVSQLPLPIGRRRCTIRSCVQEYLRYTPSSPSAFARYEQTRPVWRSITCLRFSYGRASSFLQRLFELSVWWCSCCGFSRQGPRRAGHESPAVVQRYPDHRGWEDRLEAVRHRHPKRHRLHRRRVCKAVGGVEYCCFAAVVKIMPPWFFVCRHLRVVPWFCVVLSSVSLFHGEVCNSTVFNSSAT